MAEVAEGNLYQTPYGWERSIGRGYRQRGELYAESDGIVRFRPNGTIIPPSTVGEEVTS